VVNEVAVAYWDRQGLAQAVRAVLRSGDGVCADEAAWQTHLTACGVTGERQRRIATAGALLGSLIHHGVAADLVVLSDGAPPFDVLVQASCWLHAERPLARLVPFGEAHRQAIDGVRRRLGELYQELKGYRHQPASAASAALAARCDALVAERTGFPSVEAVLKEMAAHRADLLRVLERPEVPLHNNVSESHIREYVTKRKVSGGTRSEAGRRCRDTFASLKKTCRALGVNFWESLRDRVRGQGVVPRLAERIGRCGSESSAVSVAAAPG
jgi:Transposase IS66 family